VVEHVQVSRAARWWAGTASAYCVAMGLVLSWADWDSRLLSWAISAFFAAITATPQPFRSRRAFLVACWSSVTLIAVLGLLTAYGGGCVFWPAAVPLLVAAVQPAVPTPRKPKAVAKRLAAAAAIAALLIFVAAVIA